MPLCIFCCAVFLPQTRHSNLPVSDLGRALIQRCLLVLPRSLLLHRVHRPPYFRSSRVGTTPHLGQGFLALARLAEAVALSSSAAALAGVLRLRLREAVALSSSAPAKFGEGVKRAMPARLAGRPLGVTGRRRARAAAARGSSGAALGGGGPGVKRAIPARLAGRPLGAMGRKRAGGVHTKGKT